MVLALCFKNGVLNITYIIDDDLGAPSM